MTRHNSAHQTDVDVVSLTALHVAAAIGPDHWNRTRPQPIQLSLHLHLAPLYLDTSGRSDDVADSLHYGHLAKVVTGRVDAKTEGYASPRALAADVTDAAFKFAMDSVSGDADAAREVVHAVRVVLSLPKQILLAGGFEYELTTCASEWPIRNVGTEGARSTTQAGATVRVTEFVLPALIGVNPPERLAKQRVVTDLTFFEAASTSVEDGEVDYPAVIQQIATEVERSTHFTLEKLVYEIIQTAYRECDEHQNPSSGAGARRVQVINVRCRKPSALSFADASGVEMTRVRRPI